jgi:murein DD-endopeptidase MepM/ murein hydrolase activator NlpD
VTRGQTLWRIARMYGLDVDELAAANRITDAARLEVGQKLFIPGAQAKPARTAVPVSADEDFSWPLQGTVIAGFNAQYGGASNRGINIAPRRSLDVVASRSGTVVFCDDDFLDLGKTVIIRHDADFWTVYARNRTLLVKPGDTVARGATIAQAGSSGRDPTVYLHFQVRKGSQPQNPLFYLP